MLKRIKGQLFTIPNIMCYVRILMIPFMAVLYLSEHPMWTFLLVAISSFMDVTDGIIARKLDQVTDLGKFIDPVADRLTHLTLLFCISLKHRIFFIPLTLMVFKEIVLLTLALINFIKRDSVSSAKWFGKVTTATLYGFILLHLLWTPTPEIIFIIVTVISSALIVATLVLYAIFFVRQINKPRTGE